MTDFQKMIDDLRSIEDALDLKPEHSDLWKGLSDVIAYLKTQRDNEHD